MAYVLGYWFADGCIVHSKDNSYRFLIGSKDISHLEKIKKVMNTNCKITISHYKKNRSFGIFGQMSINSKKIYLDIVRLGGCERKSLIANFPYIPDKHIRHFIRGYFDGDGCISLKNRKNKYNPFLTFLGTKSFLSVLSENLPYTAILKKNSNIFSFTFSGKKAQDVLHYMYHASSIYLNRKYALYEKAMTWTSVSPRWTEEEKEILKKEYPACGSKIEALNHRHYKAIRTEAERLGIRVIRN